MIRGSQRHLGFFAAITHRLSGLLLAFFLPIHFLVLGLAIESEAALEDAIRWTDQPLVRFGEWGLVVLLTLHLCLGGRVLVLEFLPWRDSRKRLIGLGAATSFFVGLIFLFHLR